MLVVVGAEDVLLEDNAVLAARLAVAGLAVDLRAYPASPHAFALHPTPVAQAATDDLRSWLARHHRAGAREVP